MGSVSHQWAKSACQRSSRPWLDSFSRSSMINSIVDRASRAGLVCGRRDRGSNAGAPSR